MFKRTILTGVVVVLSGLAYSQVYAANAQIVNVNLSEWKVDVSPNTATTGVPVEFHITNSGKVEHEFVIEKSGDVDVPFTAVVNGKEIESEAEEIQPGQSRAFSWTFTQPGKYWLACHVKKGTEDHFAAGMVTDFTVTGNPVVLPTTGGDANTSALMILALGGVLLLVGLAIWKLAR